MGGGMVGSSPRLCACVCAFFRCDALACHSSRVCVAARQCLHVLRFRVFVSACPHRTIHASGDGTKWNCGRHAQAARAASSVTNSSRSSNRPPRRRPAASLHSAAGAAMASKRVFLHSSPTAHGVIILRFFGGSANSHMGTATTRVHANAMALCNRTTACALLAAALVAALPLAAAAMAGSLCSLTVFNATTGPFVGKAEFTSPNCFVAPSKNVCTPSRYQQCYSTVSCCIYGFNGVALTECNNTYDTFHIEILRNGTTLIDGYPTDCAFPLFKKTVHDNRLFRFYLHIIPFAGCAAVFLLLLHKLRRSEGPWSWQVLRREKYVFTCLWTFWSLVYGMYVLDRPDYCVHCSQYRQYGTCEIDCYTISSCPADACWYRDNVPGFCVASVQQLSFLAIYTGFFGLAFLCTFLFSRRCLANDSARPLNDGETWELCGGPLEMTFCEGATSCGVLSRSTATVAMNMLSLGLAVLLVLNTDHAVPCFADNDTTFAWTAVAWSAFNLLVDIRDVWSLLFYLVYVTFYLLSFGCYPCIKCKCLTCWVWDEVGTRKAPQAVEMR